jgi:hypothetical protein
MTSKEKDQALFIFASSVLAGKFIAKNSWKTSLIVAAVSTAATVGINKALSGLS